MTLFLPHGKVELALHALAEPDEGHPLLLLHALGSRTPDEAPPELAAWPGPVYGIDFTGHGASSVPAGGGYHPEVLMADADAALQHLGAATLLGRGLGAYVALQLAGARPLQVRGAILRDGPGLAGGGPEPGSPVIVLPPPASGPPDPFAIAELGRDLRPPDYATLFVRQAVQLSKLERPISVCARQRPPWLRAVVEEPGVEETSLAEALAHHAMPAPTASGFP